MRICNITESYPSRFEAKTNAFALHRGTSLHNDAKKLAEKGAAVSVITSKVEGEAPNEVFEGIPVYRVRKRGMYPAGFVWRMMYAVLVLHRKQRIDIIHGHWAGFSGLAAILAGKIIRKPVVISIYGNDIMYAPEYRYGAYCRPVLRPIVRYILLHATCILSLSPLLAEEMHQQWKVKRNAIILPLAVGDEYLKGATPVKFGKRIRLLTVARTVKRKRVSDIVRAAAMLQEAGIDFVLHIVGKAGDEQPEIERLIAEHHLQGKVICTGAMKNRDVIAYYERCQIFILTSVAEGFGNVFFEALSRRRPVIMSDTTGCSRILQNNVHAVIIPPLQPERIFRAILSLIRNTQEAKRMAERGYALVRDYHTYDHRAAQLLQIYRDCIRRGDGAR